MKNLRSKINKLVSSYGIAKNADLVEWLLKLIEDEFKEIESKGRTVETIYAKGRSDAFAEIIEHCEDVMKT